MERKRKTTGRKRAKLLLTEKEEDLIRAIRNYRLSYPNGHPELEYFIRQLFEELLDQS